MPLLEERVDRIEDVLIRLMEHTEHVLGDETMDVLNLSELKPG